MRAPRSRAAASCRSARATASRSSPPPTTAARALDGRCVVTLSGVTPAARFWTVTLYDPDGRLVPNSADRYGFTSQEIARHADGSFEIVRRAARAPGQLAADRRHRPLRRGAAPLRHAGRRRDADRQGCPDAVCQHRELPMIRWAALAARRASARRHRASVEHPAAAAHRHAGRLHAPRRRSAGNSIVPLPAPDAGRRGAAVHGSGLRQRRLPLRSRGRAAQAARAGQPGLYVGVVLYAATASPITRSTTARPAGASSSST